MWRVGRAGIFGIARGDEMALEPPDADWPVAVGGADGAWFGGHRGVGVGDWYSRGGAFSALVVVAG